MVFNEVPPWICTVAELPPTASAEPAAWRDPHVEIDCRELAPGEAKYDKREFEALADVRRPTPVSAAISADVKADPDMVVEVGLVVIKEMYLTAKVLIDSSKHEILT